MFLSEFDSHERYTAWHTAANGYLYAADSHYWNKSTDPPKIRKYNLSTGGTQVATRPFSVGAGAPPETIAPTGTVLSPARDAAVPAGPIAIGGRANDDVAVASVEIAIKDRSSGLWWEPGTGTWGSTLRWMPTTVAAPGSPDTAWSAIWDGGRAGGSYFVQARVRDMSSNGDAVHATTRFTMV